MKNWFRRQVDNANKEISYWTPKFVMIKDGTNANWNITYNYDDNWISVKDALPKIPEGQYGIQVIVAVFDPVYAELNNGDGYDVYQAHYGTTRDRDGNVIESFEGTDKEFDFMELWDYGDGNEWGPINDEVTHWQYMPKPPKRK